MEESNDRCFIVVFPQALPIDPSRPAGSRLPEGFLRGWHITTNDTLWWTHVLAANIHFLENPKFPVVHPLDSPFLDAIVHEMLRRYRAYDGHSRYPVSGMLGKIGGHLCTAGKPYDVDLVAIWATRINSADKFTAMGLYAAYCQRKMVWPGFFAHFGA